MKVYFIGAGPGDPELLTVKATRVLKDADIVIFAGSLVPQELLRGHSSARETYDSSSMSLEEVLKVYQDSLNTEHVVARVHSGDPSLYGAIQEQIEWLEMHAVDYEIVPGISAFQAGAARLKQELTMPGGPQTIILTRASGRTPKPEAESLEKLAATGATLCIYLSVDQIESVSQQLMRSLPVHTPVVVIQYISRPNEKIVHGDLNSIAALVKLAGIDRTALIYVGSALTRNAPEKSLLYDKSFSHNYRKAADEHSARNKISINTPVTLEDLAEIE